jgi:hypothetical protein
MIPKYVANVDEMFLAYWCHFYRIHFFFFFTFAIPAFPLFASHLWFQDMQNIKFAMHIMFVEKNKLATYYYHQISGKQASYKIHTSLMHPSL